MFTRTTSPTSMNGGTRIRRPPSRVASFNWFVAVAPLGTGVVSATAIRARIRDLIAAEPPGSPLSDNDIAETLNQAGINVARRTVAKYRESMNIGSTTERRKAARRKT